MAGAQKLLLNKVHSTDPGTEVSVLVTINLTSIIILAGSMDGLRNYLQELCSKGTEKKGCWPDCYLTFTAIE